MNVFSLHADIPVFCVKAKSFPAGIPGAFETIKKLVPDMTGRTLFGISSPINGVIMYKAAITEQFPGEGKKLGCETFVISRGEYSTKTLRNFSNDSNLLFETFKNLLDTPVLDVNFPCVEWYKGPNEVMCMVKIIKQ